jgi:hypothetical protein
VFGCIEAPPSSSRLTAAFAPQLLLPTCRAISVSPPPRGLRHACIRITPSAAVRARPPPFSTSSSQCRLTSSVASSSTISDVLHARLHCFSPCGSAPSRRAAASRALSSAPASPTTSSTPPHTCACAIQHRELRAPARADRSISRRRSRIRTRTPARHCLACRTTAPPLPAVGHVFTPILPHRRSLRAVQPPSRRRASSCTPPPAAPARPALLVFQHRTSLAPRLCFACHQRRRASTPASALRRQRPAPARRKPALRTRAAPVFLGRQLACASCAWAARQPPLSCAPSREPASRCSLRPSAQRARRLPLASALSPGPAPLRAAAARGPRRAAAARLRALPHYCAALELAPHRPAANTGRPTCPAPAAACLVEKRKEGKGTPMEKREGKTGLDSAAVCGGKKCQKRIRGREMQRRKTTGISPRAYTQNQRTAGAYL